MVDTVAKADPAKVSLSLLVSGPVNHLKKNEPFTFINKNFLKGKLSSLLLWSV